MGLVTQIAVTTDPETASDFGSQLQYSPTTLPDPLTISPASGTVELGDLIIVSSRISPDPIETNEIAVHIPIGAEAWQLVLDYTGMQTSINLTGWSATPDPANERILFKPNTGHATLTPTQGVTLQLSKLRINRQVGTAPVVIALKWRTPGSTSYRTEEQTLSLGKFPPGFYLRDFKADNAYIENGDPVTLSWDHSENATCHLLYESAEIPVTDYSKFPVQDIRRNTMFYLRARAQAGTGTAERTLSYYVTVNRPDLEVRDLEIGGKARMFTRQTVTVPSTMYSYATAQTDGLLSVNVFSSTLTIYLETSPGYYAMQYRATGGPESYVMVPVMKGQKVNFRWAESPRAGNMFWFAFGDGEFLYD
ncbi:hypothetical protein ABTY53_19190 [Streptomyces noursei]|uniref:hypothetical protein n=1 Tax=Streptomyces noursei TaxID=1971 RepID=UPI003322BE38